MIKLKNNKRGFTLAELTAVILIVGILATSAAPNLVDLTTGAKYVATGATVESLREVLLLYFMEYGTYPKNVEAFFGRGVEDLSDSSPGVTPADPAWDYFTIAPLNQINNQRAFFYLNDVAEAEYIQSAYGTMTIPAGFWYVGNDQHPDFGAVGAWGLTEGCEPPPPPSCLGG